MGAATAPRNNSKRPDVHIARSHADAAIIATCVLNLAFIGGAACMIFAFDAGVLAALPFLLIVPLGLHVGERYGCPDFFR